MNDNRIINVAIQVLPLTEDPYPIVDRAIAAIEASGVTYEVGPLETTMEGTLDELLAAAKAAHLACFDDQGVQQVVTYIKIADAREGTTIEEKTGKYRTNK